MQVSLVPEEYIMDAWVKVRPFMAEAVDYTGGRFSADDVLDLLLEYHYPLWVAFDDAHHIKGAVVTCFEEYPQKKYLRLMFCGGDKGEGRAWRGPMLETLQDWAVENGCDGIEATGRAGWAKIFQGHGYTNGLCTFELPIGEI